MERIEANYRKEVNIPPFFWEILSQQKSDLTQLREKYSEKEISPFTILKRELN